MKRTAEFVTGLIGSIIGTCIALFIFVISGFIPIVDDTVTYMFTGSFIMFLIQIVAIVLSCCVNKMNNKLYGGLMIGIGVISLFMSFLFLLIPAVLYLVSGGLAFRTLKEPTVKETI
ncbi:hypothetical protein P4J60_20975 [Bacillus cereus]|nr:hypothetical protein [Bacillus cereus]MEB9569689.1 hypothetical protein [Bacillus cereus]